ncbi:hypothetical protein X798_03890 [Onchocerca flexuosa]|uniref:Uncharacterized protein n=1 Tax=Onchocerca flexuosa TaxID=387005 RepID=A0A238BV26_9BILA|nr:hypothetical protein X798_03890 [Onchocerca flexuosa]
MFSETEIAMLIDVISASTVHEFVLFNNTSQTSREKKGIFDMQDLRRNQWEIALHQIIRRTEIKYIID